MSSKLMKGIALLLALVMALAAVSGCKRKKPIVPDLPVVTANPNETDTPTPEPLVEYTEDPAGSQQASVPTEAPTEAATEAPTNTPAPTATPKPTVTPTPTNTPTPAPTECPVREDGKYDSKDEVALYIHLFGHLPSNYITKREAQAKGWPGGSLEPYAPGCSIGGDHFGNYEGLLPTAPGRKYTECDIDTAGKRSRGAKRIIFSNDGLIFYTDDHYESFTQLYGPED